jgi:hypothetical protein
LLTSGSAFSAGRIRFHVSSAPSCTSTTESDGLQPQRPSYIGHHSFDDVAWSFVCGGSVATRL